TISPSLLAAFTVDTLVGCAPFDVQFYNQSENAVTNFWDFGDGTSSNDESPLHTYYAPGTYDVALWIYAGNGNDSTAVFNQVVVNPSPVANFHNYELNPASGSDTVQFADNSIFADNWLWDFGDPASGADNSSTEQNPLHVFGANGTYMVTLWVTNNFGCADSISIVSSVNVGIDGDQEEPYSVIYPNPVSDRMDVKTYVHTTKDSNWQIINVLGEIVYSKNYELKPGMNRNRLDVTQLANGSYVLKILLGDEEHSHQFVVDR
ncbi:MAG: PKD domain-containing protein, partial [Flavobacteriales bacterium]|nr:PKD domain-containing protein [Flavobacteriales bacterium]